MLNAMTQGNDGSLSTIHANSSADVVNKIATYAIQAPERLPWEATVRLVASGLDFIVFIRRHRTAGRAAACARVGPRGRGGDRGRAARHQRALGPRRGRGGTPQPCGAGPLPRRPHCCRVAPHERGVDLMSTTTLLIAFMVTVGAAAFGMVVLLAAGARAAGHPGLVARIRPGRLGQAADLRRRRGRRCPDPPRDPLAARRPRGRRAGGLGSAGARRRRGGTRQLATDRGHRVVDGVAARHRRRRRRA